jgi:hypothetical protein
MLKNWSWILIIAFLFAPLHAVDNPDEKKSNSIPITLVIPGIEQIKNKQYFKGPLLLGAFIGSAAAAFYYNKKGNDWYARYKASTNVEQIILYRENTESNLKKRNIYLISMFSIWILHVIDLKFFKPKKNGITGSVGKNEINIGVYYTF